MARDKSASAGNKQLGSLARLSVEHNLEKEPLRTERQVQAVSLRAKAALALKEWYVRRRMAGWLAFWVVALLLVGGLLVIKYGVGFWEWLMRFYEELAAKGV